MRLLDVCDADGVHTLRCGRRAQRLTARALPVDSDRVRALPTTPRCRVTAGRRLLDYDWYEGLDQTVRELVRAYRWAYRLEGRT